MNKPLDKERLEAKIVETAARLVKAKTELVEAEDRAASARTWVATMEADLAWYVEELHQEKS